MWEWRVFFPLSEGRGADIWPLLNAKFFVSFPSKRTDIYIVSTSGAGVKLRHKSILEVKLRERRHECGAELWEKVLHSDVEWDGRDMKSLGANVAQKMTQQRGWIATKDASSEKLKNLQDVIDLGSRELKTISLAKQRVTHYLHGLGIEQTDITSDVQAGMKWRTVCFEGRLDDILKLLQMKVTASGREAAIGDYLTELAVDSTPCGYPEFVLKLQQSLDN